MTNDSMSAFLILLGSFLRENCDKEYRHHVMKVVTRITNDIFEKEKPAALAMEEILWYLVEAFPKDVESLKPMENLCQNQIALLEPTS